MVIGTGIPHGIVPAVQILRQPGFLLALLVDDLALQGQGQLPDTGNGYRFPFLQSQAQVSDLVRVPAGGRKSAPLIVFSKALYACS